MDDKNYFEKVGAALVGYGFLSQDALAKVQSEQARSGVSFEYALNNAQPVDLAKLRRVMEEVSGATAVDPTLMTVDGEFLKAVAILVPTAIMVKARIFPIKLGLNTLAFAMLNPTDRDLIERLEAVSGLRIEPMACHERGLVDALEKHFAASIRQLPRSFFTASLNEVCDQTFTWLMGLPLESFAEPALTVINRNQERMLNDPTALEDVIRDPSIIRLVHQMLNHFVKGGASDLHFEPQEDVFRVRVRRDGVLHKMMELPRAAAVPLVARLKAIAGLPPQPAPKPTDGNIGYNVIYGRDVEFRFSALTSLHGEKVVLRVLDRSRQRVSLKVIGFHPEQLEIVERAIFSPNGLVLVTGPTGSGKTSTLYAVLDAVNDEKTCILTAENPVESKVAGTTQVNCDPEGGVTFATALRSFLRQDPDIIMVGEIRDQETADISLKAALTGHLVLSTLHTNDAPSAVMRLVNMGLETFLVAAALRIVIAQRLVRILCTKCKKAAPLDGPTWETYRRLTKEEPRGEIALHDAVGCPDCGGSGYRGRAGVFEVMPVSDGVSDLIATGARTSELRKRALEEGMLTLRASGLRMAREGRTTLEEVMRVTGAE